MRALGISIEARTGTNDNVWSFTNSNSDIDNIYQFHSAELNYSIQTSNVTSTLILSMNTPLGPANVLRSGQPVTIIDNGQVVFEGVILLARYLQMPIPESGAGAMPLVLLILGPSIYQFTITPMIFDDKQRAQINSLLGVDLTNILVGQVAQDVSTESLLTYIANNSDYNLIFNKTIQSEDLPSKVFLMTDVGQSKDSVLRSSLDYLNTVLYQQEDGTIVIRQLDASIKAPFNIDVANQYINNAALPSDNYVPILPLLEYDYFDGAYNTPAVVSNYAILSPETAFVARTSELILSYAPNPQFFPRIKQLQDSGWFTGIVGRTQINQNVVTDPAVRSSLAGFQASRDQYMINVIPRNVAKEDFIASYQALLTAKEMGQALLSYGGLKGTINLDDPSLPHNFNNIIGKSIQISNCDLSAGIIASATRSYEGEQRGATMTFSIVPLGSITGYYKS